MKTKRIAALILMVIALVSFASCDMITEFIDSRTRPVPLIQIYNSNLEKNLKMVPNDTLYVEVGGLIAGKLYTVQVLDPSGDIVTEMITQAVEDENLGYGVIKPSPLWYDIGFEYDDETGRMSLPESDIGVSAFEIRVFNEEEHTDFNLPFFFVSTDDNFDRAQPIIMAGKMIVEADGEVFSMENAFYSNSATPPEGYTNQLFVQVENMSKLRSTDIDPPPARIWILPFTGDSFEDGKYIADQAYFYLDVSIEDLMAGPVPIPWPSSDDFSDGSDAVDMTSVYESKSENDTFEIPAYAENNSYSVFLDMMDGGVAGVYQIKKEGFKSFYLDSIDGNGVAGFIVKEPPVEEKMNIQLASGGVFRYRRVPYTYTYGGTEYTYYRYQYDYDYRDTFAYHGYDTKYSSHSGPFWGYGVKVIWNPYRTPSGWTSEGIPAADIPSRFWGRYVDVYIIEADAPLTGPLSEIAHLARRLPVQYGCSNGWWQQTIWRAPMDPGEYVVVVDIDRDGMFDGDTDLIDRKLNAADPAAYGFKIE
ncbi:MAG: hypothetical protein ACQEQU_07620 [Spirochaetota bacterium]